MKPPFDLSFDLPDTGSNRSSMIESPTSSIFDVSLSDGNRAISPALENVKRRERHLSGGNLELDPFSDVFKNDELEKYFNYFVEKKIRKAKVYQHLMGFQLHRMEEKRNFSDINAQSSDEGWTALHWACKTGQREIVEVLLQCQVDPFIKNKNGSAAIHLAISGGHHKIVLILLKKHPSLLKSKNDLNGWYPIHTAAYMMQYKCLESLIQCGASVIEKSEIVNVFKQQFTPFHLVSYRIIRRKVKRVLSREEVEESIRRMTMSKSEDDVDDTDHEKILCIKIIDLLIKNLPEAQIPAIDDMKHGTILHCLASLDYEEGIKTIINPPYSHDVDVENYMGVTPLLEALNSRSLNCALMLLEHGADPHKIHPDSLLSPLQILLMKASDIQEVHLRIVDVMMEKGVDPRHTHNDASDSPLYMATNTNFDMRLLEKFIDYLDPEDVNVRDGDTGETLMHYAAVNCNSDIICKILEKNADVMIENKIHWFDYDKNACDVKPTYEIPLQTSISKNKSKFYFDAVRRYGINKLIDTYYRDEDKDKLIRFLKTHLVGACKEMYCDFVRDICHFLLQGTQTVPKLNKAEINHIVHYRNPRNCRVVFHKTALNWANENNDKVTAMELIKFETYLHHSKRCGLECFKENLSRDALLPWIIDTYGNFYEKTKISRQVMAGITVFMELFIFSYLTFMYDYYSDISLLYQYDQFASADEGNTTLWICPTINFTSSCQNPLPYDVIKDNFNLSYWITIGTLIISSSIYVYIVLKHSNPACLHLARQKIRHRSEETDSLLKRYFYYVAAEFVYYGGIVACKLLWPVVHLTRKFRYYSAEKRSDHKDLTAESDDTWKIVKTVEYGIESSVQLFLQIWLLKPFFSYITHWEWKELMFKSFHGVLNFLTFDSYPACYIERALGKILLTVISLALGVALMKSTKPGIGACERPLRTVPIFCSILLQTVARIVALRSLIVLESPLYLSKYLIFFSVHILALFIIKCTFENRKKVKRKIHKDSLSSQLMCYIDEKPEVSLMNMLKFVISCFSSAIIMIHIHEDSSRTGRRQFSFLSHTLFMLIILLENLTLVLLPFILPGQYPTAECFRSESNIDALLWVVFPWIGAVVFQIIHYKWAHPWAELNGPQDNQGWTIITRLCCKEEIQKMAIRKGKFIREDFDRNCLELEALKLEYNSNGHVE